MERESAANGFVKLIVAMLEKEVQISKELK